jgi:hypothetical protein
MVGQKMIFDQGRAFDFRRSDPRWTDLWSITGWNFIHSSFYERTSVEPWSVGFNFCEKIKIERVALDEVESSFDGVVSTSNAVVDTQVWIKTSQPIWWCIELRIS